MTKFSLFHGQHSLKQALHVEKQPQNPNWWYTRSASILRKVYIHGPIGLENLRSDYGGRKNRRQQTKPCNKSRRKRHTQSLQQLETAGLIQIIKPKGRIMTPKGRKLLQEVAGDLAKEIVKTVPELKKYQGE